MRQKFPIIEKAKRQARMIFKGISLPMLVEVPDNRVVEGVEYVYGINDRKRYLVTEKVVKFNRSALKNSSKSKVEKVDARYGGGEDTMIVKVGKPGSSERVEALAAQYAAVMAAGEEVSPFAWDG